MDGAASDAAEQQRLRARIGGRSGPPPDGFASWEEFAVEAHRQSRLVAESPYNEDDQAFVDSLSEWIWEDD